MGEVKVDSIFAVSERKGNETTKLVEAVMNKKAAIYGITSVARRYGSFDTSYHFFDSYESFNKMISFHIKEFIKDIMGVKLVITRYLKTPIFLGVAFLEIIEDEKRGIKYGNEYSIRVNDPNMKSYKLIDKIYSVAEVVKSDESNDVIAFKISKDLYIKKVGLNTGMFLNDHSKNH